jgi:uncharacterized protein (DUF849 family)
MFRTRFANKNPHVDQAGRQHLATAIDDFEFGADILRCHFRPEDGDDAVAGDQAALYIKVVSRIDDAGIDESSRRAILFFLPDHLL